jgi:tetratricopeptide (TPR) repeat protein
VPLFKQANVIYQKRGDKTNLALGLHAVSDVALVAIGALRTTNGNLSRSIALFQEIKVQIGEAQTHCVLGRPLAYRGAYAESEAELARAMKTFEKQNYVQSQGIVWAYRALRELLRLRSASQSAIGNRDSGIELARRALELADETAHTHFPVERDYVRAHWLLGAAHRVTGQAGEAERHLHEALQRCRRINLVEFEADILIDLARLRAATGSGEEAQRLAEEALLITERSEYVMQGADAHLELAKLALARDDKATATEHAEEALRLATCDGPPDYTYKAAYDEAKALLVKLA